MHAAALSILIAVLTLSAQAGAFYTTGKQWFESCWTLKNAKRSAATPDEAVAWKQCEPLAERAIYEAGFIFVGDRSEAITPAAKAVNAACPSSWSDVPISGINRLAIEMIEIEGGPKLMDRFLPAEFLIRRTFESKWPNCVTVRRAQGFPAVTKQGDEWKFKGTCRPCEAEASAQATSKPGK